MYDNGGGDKLHEAAPVFASGSLPVSVARYVDIRVRNHAVLCARIV
jgi:hypothetical protein